jgi:DNA-binding PadR family transcriptional regulator
MVDTQHSGFGKYPLRHVALGLLIPGPKHGYGLYKDFETQFGSIWKAGQTKFYVLLNTLEDEGYLGSSKQTQSGRPNRKVYHLLPSGRAVFDTWIYRPVKSLRAVRVEFIAKLRFFDLLSLPDVGLLLNAQEQAIQAMADEWQAAPTDGEDPFFAIVDAYRIQQAQAVLRWLRDIGGTDGLKTG